MLTKWEFLILEIQIKEKKKIEAIVIECDPTKITINNTLITFPTNYASLKQIIGEANRIKPIQQTKNKVYLWDNLGIYCATPDPDKMLMLLFVEDNRYGLGHQPLNNFTGTFLIDGEPIKKTIENVTEDRPYMIRAIQKENQQVAIALGWNPGS